MAGISSIASSALPEEVPQDPHTGGGRALGMELRAPEISASHGRAERKAILRGRERVLGDCRGVAVHEIGVRAVLDAFEQRIGLEPSQLVPSHVRHGTTRPALAITEPSAESRVRAPKRSMAPRSEAMFAPPESTMTTSFREWLLKGPPWCWGARCRRA